MIGKGLRCPATEFRPGVLFGLAPRSRRRCLRRRGHGASHHNARAYWWRIRWATQDDLTSYARDDARA